MWGVIYRNKLIQYGAKKDTIAIKGTNFYIYTDLEEAIDARDRLSGPFPMVVVDMSEVRFISFEESKKWNKG